MGVGRDVNASARPRVSVVIPSYNAEAFLADAVQSVLRQTWRDLELVIVNDGSTDSTGALAERFREGDARVRIVEKPNGGLSSARNAGIAASSGDLICFLDADDILLPNKLERQVSFLDDFPGCDLVYSDYYIGDGELTPIWLESVRPGHPRMDQWLLYRNRFAPMSPLLRARLVAATGDFDQTLRAAEDWDYWIRAAQLGRFSYLPGAVGVYRVHPGQMHHDLELMRSNGRRVADKNFQRGSRNWRVLMASWTWSRGRDASGLRRLALLPVTLAQTAWIARSPRILRDVLRWA
jgi:glycosyltransferase involved in cell wall biosynthesis